MRIWLYRFVFYRNLRTVFTLLFSTMVFMSHIYCWQIARLYLILSESHRGCLIWVNSNLSKFGSKNLKASLISAVLKVRNMEHSGTSTRSLFSDKARCFSQSERALYGNFILIYIMYRQINESKLTHLDVRCSNKTSRKHYLIFFP